MESFKTKVFKKSEVQPTYTMLWWRNAFIGIPFLILFFLFPPDKAEADWIWVIKFTLLGIGMFAIKFADWPYWRRKELLKGEFVGTFEVLKDKINILDRSYQYGDLKSITFNMDKHKGQRIENTGVYKESKGVMNHVVIKTKNLRTSEGYFFIESPSHSDKLYFWYQKINKEYPDLEIEWIRKEVEEKESSYSLFEVILIILSIATYIYFEWIY